MTVGDFESRLRSRLEHVGLSAEPHFLRAAERYYSLLGRWNATTNLTALALEDFPARTLDRLFVEPLQAAELVEDSPLACVDVGSGGGSPAIPLKLARPSLCLTLVESVAKKTAFLREAVRELGLVQTEVLTARIEEVVPRLRGADLVLIRGVRTDQPLATILAKLLKPGGRILRFGSASERVPAGFREVERRRLATGGELLVLRADLEFEDVRT
ncbi:MAG: 16S rRNA (guanine(527)-N(7))-methyltransferase RsmG [Acidobacteria bacterium RIFCSPLOWO2_02_FULL_65_29]|nr:MAG: 16S rRNA (guanine(527)-N(7))-methyltransferase RsmG [Acidobacteria bacterium RIFCSPLOWO2_02_FULL_65_29]